MLQLENAPSILTNFLANPSTSYRTTSSTISLRSLFSFPSFFLFKFRYSKSNIWIQITISFNLEYCFKKSIIALRDPYEQHRQNNDSPPSLLNFVLHNLPQCVRFQRNRNRDLSLSFPISKARTLACFRVSSVESRLSESNSSRADSNDSWNGRKREWNGNPVSRIQPIAPSHTGNFCYVSRAIHSSLVRILFLALVQNRANKTNWKEQSRGDVHRDRIRKGITRLFSSIVQYFPFLVSSFITCIGFRGFYRFRCESRYINCSIARKEKKEGKKETAYNDSF